MTVRTTLWTAALLGVALLTGCQQGKEKESALKEMDKIDLACKEGDQDEARKLLLDAAVANPQVKAALDAATKGVEDKSRVNPCGLALVEMKSRLER